MRSRVLGTVIGLALLLLAVALLAVGCGSRRAATTSPTPFAETTSTTPAAAAVVDSGTLGGALRTLASTAPADNAAKGSSAGKAPSASGSTGLSASQGTALDAELAAIQTELDRLSLPAENDFDSIGLGLK